jgi:hypothetical protein
VHRSVHRVAANTPRPPLSPEALDADLLVRPAVQAGLTVYATYAYIAPGTEWTQSETIHYQEDSWLCLDADAISARLGGINSIGVGWVVSASIGWGSKLVNKPRDC